MSLTAQPRFPVESVTCPHCRGELPVGDGVDPRDLLWLHERRCGGEALFPDVSLVCAACDGELPLGDGLSADETLWMHELECPCGLGEYFAAAS
jgi:hypothetical protein